MRGEDAAADAEGETSMGSPPHARGRPVEATMGVSEKRITPACAGKT